MSSRFQSASMSCLAGLLFSIVFLLACFSVRYVVGPLNVDEVYFGHTLWLTIEGKRQFIDFYSNHFPTYFSILNFVLSAFPNDDLSFIINIRYFSILLLVSYFLICTKIVKSSTIFVIPVLLFMIIFGRMIELRTDTFGLILFAGAWAVLLSGATTARILSSSLLALGAAAFSARAGVMLVGLALVIVALFGTTKNWRGLTLQIALACLIGTVGLIFYLSDSEYWRLVAQATLFDPSHLFSEVSLRQRLFAYDRTPLVALTIVALIMACLAMKDRDKRERAIIVFGASASQIALILFDPSPFTYVYVWAALPVAVAIGDGFSRHQGWLINDWRRGLLGMACAAYLASPVVAFALLKGRTPPTGSIFRITIDPPMNQQSISRLETADLIEMMIQGQGQHSLRNQMAVREELCSRFDGQVLASWSTHPICMEDANYYWNEIRWPNIHQDEAPAGARWFKAIFVQNPPDLFIWATPEAAPPLGQWVRASLADYDIWKGYAILRKSSDRSILPCSPTGQCNFTPEPSHSARSSSR